MTLKDVMNLYVLKILDECGGNRTETAKKLDISIRTLRNYINDMRDKGIDIVSGAELRNWDMEKSIFPTNKERLEHLDKVINANFL